MQLRIPKVSPLYGWLALVLLEIEFKTQEAFFWQEFLRQLAVVNGRNSLEAALKVTEQADAFLPNISIKLLLELLQTENICGIQDVKYISTTVACDL